MSQRHGSLTDIHASVITKDDHLETISPSTSVPKGVNLVESSGESHLGGFGISACLTSSHTSMGIPCCMTLISRLMHWLTPKNSSIQALIDKHCSTVYEGTLRPRAPWYTDVLRQAKHERRKRERVWRRTRMTVHHQIFKEQCQTVTQLIHMETQGYMPSTLAECGND